MPTYEYFCETCEESFEAVQKFTDAPLTTCPTGHERVRRLIRPAGIIFKGSGWYIKDSKGSSTVTGSSKSEAPGESKGEPAGESKSESAGESKSESKSEPSSAGESKSESKSESKGPVASEAA